MKLYEKLRGRLPELLDLPDQTLPGVPIIEIYGDRRVLIEGRCRVIQYGGCCIKLRNGCGVVCVCGHGLKMAELSYDKMIVVGKIEGISFSGG